MRFLGIDIGGTFIKAAVLDLETMTVQESARIEFPPFLPATFAGQREVDPQEVISRSKDLLAHVAGGAKRWAGLMVSGQMGGLVLLDREGRPKSNYISWQDMRAEDAPAGSIASAAELGFKLSKELIQRTGNDFRASNTLKVLHWMNTHGQLAEGLTPVSIMACLIAHLSGNIPALHPTDAAAFGCLDLASTAWDVEVVKTAGLSRLSWPNVTSTHIPVAEFVLNGETIPIYPAAGDQQAALAGVCLAESELSINIATGSQVAELSTSLIDGDFQVRPYFDGSWICTITHIPAGRSLRALLEFTGSARVDWDALDAEVNSTPETDLEVSLSFFPGSCGDRGYIKNLRETNMHRGHLLRAVFKSMAENYLSCSCRLPNKAPSKIVFSGGLATRYSALQQEIISRFRRPARIASDREDALLGLLLVAKANAERVPLAQVSRTMRHQELGH